MSGRVAKLLVAVMMVSVAGAGRLAAQARLTGTVRDTTGAPIAGVEISVQGISRTATTDRAGAFQLGDIPTGTASVTVRRVGFAPQTTIMKFANGDNDLGVVVLTATARELDTMQTRAQELYREYPLLREFDENKKIGLGQFISRQQLAMNQGGFMTPVLNQMRGIMMIRSANVASHAWVANSLVPSTTCTALEDLSGTEAVTPVRDAACNYCFPSVFLDNSLIAPRGIAANIGRFNPDQFEAIEIFLGDAETPAKYIGRGSGCGVIVLISRVVPRRANLARHQDHPTRSRVYANAAVSLAKTGKDCPLCGSGAASDFRAGYTFSDRWVVGVRAGNWSGQSSGLQSMKLRQALLEWYPHPEPGRFKWFGNAALGSMSVDLYSAKSVESSDRYVGSGLPAVSLGTGVDVSVVQRFVVTPFFSYDRNVGGRVARTHCITHIPAGSTSFVTDCGTLPSNPATFTLLQLGTRVGWR
jgi:hypothetical protein